ncbi:hypothetical protein GGI43DRAFT_147969 [Trichoderma evansii]
MRSAIILTAFIATALADYSATPDKCVADCNAAHDACVTKPDANHAECASQYAACLGYNPYENGFVAPTACSKTTSPSWPTKTAAPPPQDECAKKCCDDYDKCRGAPGANQSTCSSEYAKCLGYNPFDGQHDHEEKPTKCSTRPVVTPTGPPQPPPPKVDCKHVKECSAEEDKCRVKPEANQAQCSSEYAGCLGFNPFTPEGENYLKQCEEEGLKPGHNETRPKPPPVIVSGGSSMKPLGFFSFLAVAAGALL